MVEIANSIAFIAKIYLIFCLSVCLFVCLWFNVELENFREN